MIILSRWMKARNQTMKNKMKYVLVPLMVVALSSCGSKFQELYAPNQYETANFLDNYYTERRGFDDIQVNEQNIHNIEVEPFVHNGGEEIENLRNGDQYDSEGNFLSWDNDFPEANIKDGYGPYNALIHKNSGFSYGYISKLYDGRVRCDGFYARSRVQLDACGYATYFPKALSSYKYFGIALRGGTDCERSFGDDFPELDIHLSFLKHDTETGIYSKYNFEMKDITVMTNNGGRTCLVYFYFDTVLKPTFGDSWNTILKDTVAMSLTFDLKQCKYDDLVMDRKAENKKHFAVMLYEVLLPNSSWY